MCNVNNCMRYAHGMPVLLGHHTICNWRELTCPQFHIVTTVACIVLTASLNFQSQVYFQTLSERCKNSYRSSNRTQYIELTSHSAEEEWCIMFSMWVGTGNQCTLPCYNNGSTNATFQTTIPRPMWTETRTLGYSLKVCQIAKTS